VGSPLDPNQTAFGDVPVAGQQRQVAVPRRGNDGQVERIAVRVSMNFPGAIV